MNLFQDSLSDLNVQTGHLPGLLSLCRVSGKLIENTDISITRTNHRKGYNLIGFDVDPTTAASFTCMGNPKWVIHALICSDI